MSSTAQLRVDDIREHLREILASKSFSMSRRCGDFLAFIVEQTLLGLEHELKERTIGIAVFGRDSAYDTGDDAVVRIKASETRKRLAMYYAERATPSPIIISLPTGGYIPHFLTLTQTQPAPTPSESDLKTTGPSLTQTQLDAPLHLPANHSKYLSKKLLACASALVLIAALCCSYFIWRSTHPSLLTRFWKPILVSQGTVYLVTSSAPVYIYEAPDSPLKPTDKGKYVLINDQFVGRGDMLANDLIDKLLNALAPGKPIKSSDAINLREMSGHSVVLIGYASTKWGALSHNLRYFVDDNNVGMITDFGHETDWFPHHLNEDLTTDEDYALIARVYDPETRSTLVLISGATQYGTEAAAAFISNSDYLAEALKSAPPDWEHKNLEIVIHVKVIGNTPAAPEVVALDFR